MDDEGVEGTSWQEQETAVGLVLRGSTQGVGSTWWRDGVGKRGLFPQPCWRLRPPSDSSGELGDCVRDGRDQSSCGRDTQTRWNR